MKSQKLASKYGTFGWNFEKQQNKHREKEKKGAKLDVVMSLVNSADDKYAFESKYWMLTAV